MRSPQFGFPPSILARLTGAAVLILAVPAFCQTTFVKDEQVRLTKEAPLYFQDKEVRQGKTGETFTVLQYNAAKKRVYVLGTDESGKPVAYNLPGDALAVVPVDLAGLLQAVESSLKADGGAEALKAVTKAATSSPGSQPLQQLHAALQSLSTAREKLADSKVVVADAAKKALQLNRNAQVAARPNPLNGRDNTGFLRAQAMTQQAQQLVADAAKDSEDAQAAFDKAKQDVTSLIAQARNPVRTEPTASVMAAGSGAKTLASMMAAYKVKENLEANVRSAQKFIAGNYYRLVGLQISQATSEFLLVYVAGDTQPAALVIFPNPQAVSASPMRREDFIDGVARFVEYRDVPLSSGPMRLPVFECAGFEDPIGQNFVNTEKSP